jgi:PAS domain S-box-containing protein
MTSRQQLVQTLYEISLGIESRQTLEETADRALTSYLKKLNCSVGAIFWVFTTEEQVELTVVSSIPSNPDRNDLFQTACDRLRGLVERSTPATPSVSLNIAGTTQLPWEATQARDDAGTASVGESLPVSGTHDETNQFHLLELPGFGVLMLGKRGGSIDARTVSALDPLNEKLAQACQSNRNEQKIKDQRDRFEAVFDAIPEPVVSVVVDDGTERILRANETFRETFGYDPELGSGQKLNPLVTADNQSVDTDELVEAIGCGEPFTSEVKRETVSGDGYFLFSGVPVVSTDITEYFGVYADITEQKKREQTLEDLYVAAQDLVAEESRQRVCEQTVAAVESVLGYSSVGVHLYNRDSEALEPVATSDRLREELDGGPAGYTDRETVIWDAYKTGEPVRIDDTTEFDGTLPSHDSPTRSAVILPIGVHGVLMTSAFDPNRFDDEDVYFLRLLGQLVDIALDRTANEKGLTTAQRAIRETLHAETHEEMAEIVIEQVPEFLDLPIAGVWKHQPARQTLEPLEQTEQANTMFDQQPPFPKGDSIAWQAFETGSTTIVSDVSERSDAYNADTRVKGEIIVPIGDFGVLTAGSTYKNSFTELDANLLEILATNLAVVAEVIDSRQDISLLQQVIARVLRHNVRNKLSPIKGYADAIVQESEDPVETYASRILESCEALEKTTEHAREMRKVVENRNQMTTLSLGTEVRSAAATVEGEFSDGVLVSQIEHTPEVTAHPELSTAIRHLIRNGFEHNDTGTPRVEVTVEERSAGPTIEISDNGPGIDVYELENVDNQLETALEHGSGSGLWIIDRLIKYSEALLEFETSDGTTATITFPSNTTRQTSRE